MVLNTFFMIRSAMKVLMMTDQEIWDILKVKPWILYKQFDLKEMFFQSYDIFHSFCFFRHNRTRTVLIKDIGYNKR